MGNLCPCFNNNKAHIDDKPESLSQSLSQDSFEQSTEAVRDAEEWEISQLNNKNTRFLDIANEDEKSATKIQKKKVNVEDFKFLKVSIINNNC